ncbi:hypothetical protein CRENBAI_023795 [Crenichthys baileyi]|uniref:Uncharacterized protein n=1 Tax=Crenichthys baileyi TaxID=28760 RepID=A0AAV9SPX8_9TELE
MTLHRPAGLPYLACEGSRLANPWSPRLLRHCYSSPLHDLVVKPTSSSRRRKHQRGAASSLPTSEEEFPMSAAATAGVEFADFVDPPMPSPLPPVRVTMATPDKLEERLRIYAHKLKFFRRTVLFHPSLELKEKSGAAAQPTPGLQSAAAQRTTGLQSSAKEFASTTSTRGRHCCRHAASAPAIRVQPMPQPLLTHLRVGSTLQSQLLVGSTIQYPLLGFKERLVNVLVSEPSDEGFEDDPPSDPVPELFEDEPLPDPVPEGFKDESLLAPFPANVVSASASKGPVGSASVSEAPAVSASASEGPVCSASASETPNISASASEGPVGSVSASEGPASSTSASEGPAALFQPPRVLPALLLPPRVRQALSLCEARTTGL